MEDVLSLVRLVFDEGYVMSLGTTDDDGPWVADVIYVCDNEFNVYWLSDINARHSKAIGGNSRVAGTITISNKPEEKLVGVQIEGKAVEVKGDMLEIMTTHSFRRPNRVPKKEEEKIEYIASVYKPNKSKNSWYKLTPTSIDLISEPDFGMTKKRLKLPINNP